jgi:hypothetical protein
VSQSLFDALTFRDAVLRALPVDPAAEEIVARFMARAAPTDKGRPLRPRPRVIVDRDPGDEQ